jgi:hypothetical protein
MKDRRQFSVKPPLCPAVPGRASAVLADAALVAGQPAIRTRELEVEGPAASAKAAAAHRTRRNAEILV